LVISNPLSKKEKRKEKKSKHFVKENAHHMLFEMPAFLYMKNSTL